MADRPLVGNLLRPAHEFEHPDVVDGAALMQSTTSPKQKNENKQYDNDSIPKNFEQPAALAARFTA
jgi:hypothetical protein